ncbi:MAG: hypothetical protein ACI9P8_001115 [Bacteroidia bacterium]|jgi:hypothetical protein
MDSVTEIILSAGYVGLFLWLISKWSFFKRLEVPIIWIQGAFLLKVLSGVFLYLIYTRYYTDRFTADIFKYFDDSMVIYSAVFDNPSDFFRMMCGIGNDNAYFNDTYYDVMNNWNRPYGSSLGNDTHSIIRFNAITRFISLGYYNVHSVVLNFLSLIGLAGIFLFLKRLVPNTPRILFVLVFLFPGVLFWGSGVLKEGLLFFGLGMMLYCVTRALPVSEDEESEYRWVFWVGLILSFVFLTSVKSYVLIAIVPGILALRVSQWRKIKNAKPVIGSYLAGLIVALSLGYISPELNGIQRLVDKQKDFIALATGGTYVKTTSRQADTLYILPDHHANLEFNSNRTSALMMENVEAVHWSDAKLFDMEPQVLMQGEEFEVLLDLGNAGSKIDIPVLESNPISFLINAPVAFVNGLLRPFPWEARSPFMLLALIENLILMILFGLMLWKFSSANVNWQIWWIAILFALVIILLTGWVTPVIGAIVRYKVPALPFVAAAIVAMINHDFLKKIEKKLSFLG